MDRPKCPLYRGVRIIEVGNVWFLAFLGPNELSVIERCPCYRGVRKERLDCTDDVSPVRSGYYAYYASDCSWREGNLLQPIKSTTQTWLVTRHQYGILAIVSQTSFRGGISRGVAKCRLFSQAIRKRSFHMKRPLTSFRQIIFLFLHGELKAAADF